MRFNPIQAIHSKGLDVLIVFHGTYKAYDVKVPEARLLQKGPRNLKASEASYSNHSFLEETTWSQPISLIFTLSFSPKKARVGGFTT